MKVSRLVLAAAIVAALSGAGANAGTITASVPVAMTVVAACSSLTAAPGGISFGSVPAVNNGGINATTTLSVTCASGVPYTIALDGGTHCLSCTTSTPERVLRDAANDGRAYSIWQDANHTTFWGDGNVTYNAPTESGTGSGSAQAITVYAQASTASTTPPGSYSDTVTATLSF